MLSAFPSLFILSIFAPFILRLAVGGFFFFAGYQHLHGEQKALEQDFKKKFGDFGKAFAIIVAVVELAIGLALIAGFLTQIVALLGMVFVLKMLWFKRDYPAFAKHERVLYVLVFAILLTLLITGAGAPAVDLPL